MLILTIAYQYLSIIPLNAARGNLNAFLLTKVVCANHRYIYVCVYSIYGAGKLTGLMECVAVYHILVT